DNQRQFTLYQQYDRKDACRLLNWPKDVSAPMYGYRVGEQDTPIFITYHKDDHEKRNALYRISDTSWLHEFATGLQAMVDLLRCSFLTILGCVFAFRVGKRDIFSLL
ncbi:MAG: DUF3427 domain-containing protein, partial [Coriobacteriaceae bacterium]